ncbi:MAG: lamin tail domain-containing protein [Bacteroidetes bacterium]|nr:lamin tail domain-containing protein [Bacteroidota bacterium]
MKKRFLGLVLMVLTLSSFGQTIAITEINYNSDPYNKSNDWVELHNYGGSAVDISNWKLKDETPFNSFTIPAGTVLDANEYVVLVENIDTFLMVHGGVTNYIGEFAFGFDNTFGTVKIENNSGTVIKAVPYIDSIPWPKGCDGYGPTLQIINEEASESNPANWRSGCVLGTPGEGYVDCNYDIVVSEINYNSLLAYNPGDWIEILNRGNSDKDISGWILRDGKTDNIFVIPAGNVLSAGERLVIADSLESFTVKFPTVSNVIGEPPFSFSNGGDAVRLYTPSGKIQYSVRYKDSAPWPLDPDGTGFTLELVDEPGNPNDGVAWVAGCLYGSPGNPFVIPCPNAVNNVIPKELTIGPNPFADYLTIIIDATVQAQSVTIMNTLGEQIITLPPYNNAVTWNSTDLQGNTVSDGIYFVVVTTTNGNTITAKVLKAK